MKIIQQGDNNKVTDIKRFVCKECGCVFEADNTEFKAEYAYGQYLEGYSCDCPNCGKSVFRD